MNLESALLDLYIFRLRRVGRRNMTDDQIHHEWLERGE